MEAAAEGKKEYLKSYQWLKKEILSLIEEKEKLRSSRIFHCVVNDGMPKGSSFSDLSVYASRLDELERIIQEKIEELIKLQYGMEISIQAMDNETERTLLRQKYLCGKTWEQVAVDMGYSWQHIHKIHAKALQHFEKVAIVCDSSSVI